MTVYYCPENRKRR